MNKKCTLCRKPKPFTVEYFYAHEGGKNGLSPRCKVCQLMLTRKCREKRKKKDPRALLEQEKISTTRWRRTHAEQHRETSRKWKMKNPARVLAVGARSRALKAGVPYDLDRHLPELEKLMARGCALTGLPFSTGKRGPLSASLDRKHPEKGYVFSNVRPVCWCLNAALGNWGEAPTLEIFEAWRARRK